MLNIFCSTFIIRRFLNIFNLPTRKIAANKAPLKNMYRLSILKNWPDTPTRSLAAMSVAPPKEIMLAISDCNRKRMLMNVWYYLRDISQQG